MIKHGKIHQFRKRAPTHLEPIAQYITKGIADAKEKLVLHPKRCDIKGAKRFNTQCCVVARVANRERKPQAVSVGRAVTWMVFDGLGIRFRNPPTTTTYVEAFDEHGKASLMPVELLPPEPSRRMGKKRSGSHSKSKETRRAPGKKIGLRAIGGGVTVRGI